MESCQAVTHQCFSSHFIDSFLASWGCGVCPSLKEDAPTNFSSILPRVSLPSSPSLRPFRVSQRRKLPAAAGAAAPGRSGCGTNHGSGLDERLQPRPPPLPLSAPCHLPGKMNVCPIHHPAIPDGAGTCLGKETSEPRSRRHCWPDRAALLWAPLPGFSYLHAGLAWNWAHGNAAPPFPTLF